MSLHQQRDGCLTWSNIFSISISDYTTSLIASEVIGGLCNDTSNSDIFSNLVSSWRWLIQVNALETEIKVAVISAVVAAVSAVIAIFGQIRLARLQAKLQHERDKRIKEDRDEALLSKYREPLAQASFELQSKLYNILRLDLLDTYYISGNEKEKEYAVQNTLYVIAQFFAWNEIIRREVQFLDLGEMQLTRSLSDLNEKIVVSFLTSSHGQIFRVFRGEQRAIAEKMITSENDNLTCIGYASFVEAQDNDFRRWFDQLEEDIDSLSKDLSANTARLVQLQHALIDLLDFLDPECIRFGKQYRTKV